LSGGWIVAPGLLDRVFTMHHTPPAAIPSHTPLSTGASSDQSPRSARRIEHLKTVYMERLRDLMEAERQLRTALAAEQRDAAS
jgi:hypothetical protein